MFGSLAKKIFGSVNDRRLKSYRPKVAAINAMEAELEALSDEQLRARTEEFKAQLGLHRVDGRYLRPVGLQPAIVDRAKDFLRERTEHREPSKFQNAGDKGVCAAL